MAGREPPFPKPPKPPREPASPYDPSGIDDGKGGIPLWARRPALRATAWIAFIVVLVAIGVLAWRTMERKALERVYREGVQALAEGRNDDARAAFDRAIAQRPEWGAAWRQRGYAARKPADAIGDFGRAIAIDPGDADAYAARGRAWMQSGEPAKATADYDRAIELAGRSGAAATSVAAWRADRAALRFGAGEIAAALDDLRAVAGARGAPDDHRNLAAALASSGDWHGAREEYDRAISVSPNPEWLGERALVLIELGDDDGASADLRRCVQADPSCAQGAAAQAERRAQELGRPPPAGAHP
ncbi:MAG: hypothetical protein U1F64_13320 [Burkholderiales bacterium]